MRAAIHIVWLGALLALSLAVPAAMVRAQDEGKGGPAAKADEKAGGVRGPGGMGPMT